MKLKIQLLNYWHTGSSRGGGAVIDATVLKDRYGLPILPGKHIKGLLREAVQKAEDWQWKGYEHLSRQLFGDHSKESLPQSGCLWISNAQLNREIADWLASSKGLNYRPYLFKKIYASAVDHQSGTALEHSLRGYEVSIPLLLEAKIAPLPNRSCPSDWVEKLRGVLSLIPAIGAHRNRGLGRAILSLEDE